MKKKAVSVICAFVMGVCCFQVNAQAKVIEPEVVKTEKWTTSYYIDDDIDTLYPYIQCEADIYNDGAIKLYMWNTHEWDGFATVSHTVTLSECEPLSTNSMAYAFASNNPYSSPTSTVTNNDLYFPITEAVYNTYKNTPSSINESFKDNSEWIGKINYVPSEYTFYTNLTTGFSGERTLTQILAGYSIGNQLMSSISPNQFHYVHIGKNSTQVLLSSCGVEYDGITIALSKIKVYTEKNSSNLRFYYIPQVDPTGTYKFRLYGHDITITPELLSENIVATPQLTEQEKYIQQLEAENAALKAENEKLKSQISILSTAKFCDVNQDGIVGVEDAQLVLIYYTETIAGLVKDDPIEIWYAKRNTI